MDYTVAVAGVETTWAGTISTSSPYVYNVNTEGFAGTLTTELVLENTAQGLVMESANITVTSLVSGFPLSLGPGGPLGLWSTNLYVYNGVGSVLVNDSLTSAIINFNSNFYHTPPWSVRVDGSGAVVDYLFASTQGTCQNGSHISDLCSFAAGSHGAGTWTTTTQAPEIDSASAASGLTLLLGGIAVLRTRKRVHPSLSLSLH
jgi:hypothetical protein